MTLLEIEFLLQMVVTKKRKLIFLQYQMMNYSQTDERTTYINKEDIISQKYTKQEFHMNWRKNIMVKVKYTNNFGADILIGKFKNKDEAIEIVDKELEREKENFSDKNYDYADYGLITKIWDKENEEYSQWEIIE